MCGGTLRAHVARQALTRHTARDDGMAWALEGVHPASTLYVTDDRTNVYGSRGPLRGRKSVVSGASSMTRAPAATIP
jgi:hypothetical protein